MPGHPSTFRPPRPVIGCGSTCISADVRGSQTCSISLNPMSGSRTCS
jgi:hypothetical protein